MATATKRQAERGDNPTKQSERSSSQMPRQTRQHTQGPLPHIRTHDGYQGGLKNVKGERLAQGLGWFSIALGLTELLAPRRIAKVVGVRNNTDLIRLFGFREITSGIGIFAQSRRPAAAVWSRVAGDVLDLAALGSAYTSPQSDKRRVVFAAASVLGVTALDVTCARQLSSNDHTKGATNPVTISLIINRSPEEIYLFWRDFENLPAFMRYLKSVRVMDDGRSHWVASGPAGTSVEWDAEITADRPNELIAWRSLEGADVENSGSVRFECAPGNRGTIVRVEIEYKPPGGVIGQWLAKITGNDPEQQSREALRCLKQLMETGEVILSDGTVWNNGYLTQRPAQPPSTEELARSQAVGRV